MTRSLSMLLPVPLLLAGCTAEPPATQTAAAAPGQQRCLSTQQITNRSIAGPSTLLFRTIGGYYRNDLPAACPGLDNRWETDPIVLEVHGSQVCAGDSFRAFDASAARAVGVAAFPRCRLGPFTPISKEEAEALRPAG